jgi:nitrogen-specific signal transduction histidine kinase
MESTFALKGQKHCSQIILLPLQGVGYAVYYPGRSCLASDQRSSGRVSGNATQGLVTLEVTTPATLTITDNGHGIPPAIAKNLFTPFFSTKPQGQGLGLLLIRDILTSHHCTFNLLTDPEDHLTRFTIQFPLQKTQK